MSTQCRRLSDPVPRRWADGAGWLVATFDARAGLADRKPRPLRRVPRAFRFRCHRSGGICAKWWTSSSGTTSRSSTPSTICATRRHPQRTAHDEQQDVLVAAADALITLTPGAARAVVRTVGSESGGPAASSRVGQCPDRAASALDERSVRRGGARQERARQHGPVAGVGRARPRGRRAARRHVCSSTCTTRFSTLDNHWYAPRTRRSAAMAYD